MKVQKIIEANLSEEFAPNHLEVVNESYKHRGSPDAETHFLVVVVANIFEGKSLIKRHRLINESLKSLNPRPHALSLHPFTASEWKAREKGPASPDCAHGKAD